MRDLLIPLPDCEILDMTCNTNPSALHSVRRYKLSKPSIVSDIIVRSAGANIGRLKSDPSRVLKFCIPENAEAVAELETEKKILAILGHHPSIAQFYWASEEGICYEYYSLGSLRSYYDIKRPSLPPIDDRLRWCQQSVAGFAFIHSKRIVHGDISARNILLSPTHDIKICDFGFSRFVGEELNGLAELRYCRYRPLTESDACFMDDIFAIGCLCYEILIGKAPYLDLEDDSVLTRYRDHIFPSLESFIPCSHSIIIDKCWNEKYQSIEELQTNLLEMVVKE